MQRIFFCFILIFFSFNVHAQQETFPVNGLTDQRNTVYAFTNAKIYTDYKTVIDSATLVIKDGFIVSVSKNAAIPKDAVVFNLNGKYIYPSFIELYSDYGVPEIKTIPKDGRGPQFLSNTKGAYGWNQAIRPEVDAYKHFDTDKSKAEDLKNIGFGTALSFNKDGIVRGSGVFVSLADLKDNEVIIKDRAAAGFSFDKGSSTQDYPGSLMGSIALIRQTYYDAQWYARGGNKKEFNISLDAFNKLIQLPVIFDVKDKQSALRAQKIANEFSANYIIKSNGDEYQRVREIKQTGATFIVPVAYPDGYDVTDPFDANNVSIADMKHWELAPYNAFYLFKEGIPFVFTTDKLKDKKEFLKNIRKAIECGLPEEEALKALTATPAQLIEVQNITGALQKGMMANFFISNKKFYEKDCIISENWSKGTRYVIKQTDVNDMRGNYSTTIANKKYLIKIKGEAEKPEVQVMEDSTRLQTTFTGSSNSFSLQFEIKKDKTKEYTRLNGVYSSKDKNLKGTGQSNDGNWFNWQANFDSAFAAAAKTDSSKTDSLKNEKLLAGKHWFPNMAYGWETMPIAQSVLFKNATVWTNEKEGILESTDVLIQNGKITLVAKNINADKYANVQIVDATGKHLTAGIIDEHSHIAVTGDVNECTQSVTSEVRIGDVIDADDINIYRQLSGGVTSSHLLHGSCNPVGGQTQLIKLRWGKAPEELKFEGADGFIKFALGENVKQSNWGDHQTSRYPQSRMGVEQTYIDAFTRAREYKASYSMFEASSKVKVIEPRKDLELDALSEILNSKRFITCHSYVQSEINMLMHIADSFNFKVNTFTHILEGYKVADKMKRHGAGASAFSDWWAYKFEVYEAIPYNGKILYDMGVVTAYNSDDAEMARRLNQEAAKAVKYGGVSEEEALKFVTLNPAKLLHIDNRVGSIKAGKDADIVLWSDKPLSIYAKVLQTYVDGVKYYDEATDALKKQQIKAERARLIQKLIDAKAKGEKVRRISSQQKSLKHCMEDVH